MLADSYSMSYNYNTYLASRFVHSSNYLIGIFYLNYHSETSPGLGFSTLTTLSGFNKHKGSNANFSYKVLVKVIQLNDKIDWHIPFS